MKQKDLLFILVSAVFVVFAWIVFTIIHQSTTSTITESLGQDIAPIAQTFDKKTIETLKSRVQITPAYNVVSEPTPRPTPIPPSIAPLTPLSSSSAQTASTGGQTR